MKTNLGKILKKLRHLRKLSQFNLAEKCGIAHYLYNSIENNKGNPTVETLEKIAKGLEIPIGVIFWLGIDEENAPKNKKYEFLITKEKVDIIFNNLYDLD